MEDFTQVERQWYILRILNDNKNGCTVKEIQKKLENMGIKVSAKTVERDLDDLSYHFPIYEGERVKSRATVYFADKFRLDNLSFTSNEFLVFHFLKEFLTPFKNLPIGKVAYEIIDRIISKLPKIDKEYVNRLSNIFKIDFSAYQAYFALDKEVLDLLERSRQEGKKAKILYYSFTSDDLTERVIEPYIFYYKNGNWYVAAYCNLKNDIRDFRLDRIKKVEILSDTSYKIPDDFSYDEYVKNSWDMLKGKDEYNVVLRFKKEKARFVKEYEKNKADKISENPDGSILFERTVSNLEEIKRRILGYGRYVEVIEPQVLRKMVMEEVQEMRRHYI